MNRLFLSDSLDPYVNLAVEQQLLNEEGAVYLWRNRDCVIAGRNQNLYAEADLHYAAEHDILPVRRTTGGGCVYHDPGNLNYSFVIHEDQLEEVRMDLIRILHSLNVQAEFSGRNDILVNGRKCGGTAWQYEDGIMLFHGTLLVNTDLEKMQRVLTPASLKLKSNAVASVKSRVINLSETDALLTVEKLISAFEAYYCMEAVPFSLDASGRETAKHFASKEWIYGECSDYQAVHEIRTSQGILQADLTIHNGMIRHVRIYHDYLDADYRPNMKRLEGLFYDPENICDRITALIKQEIGNV